MCKEIEYLQNVIEHYEIHLSWLARQLNQNPGRSKIWSKQGLDYLFTTAKEISTATFTEIKNYFDEHGFIITDKHLTTNLSNSIARINKETTDLVNRGIKAFEDKTIDEKEIHQILKEAVDIEDSISELKTLLKSR